MKTTFFGAVMSALILVGPASTDVTQKTTPVTPKSVRETLMRTDSEFSKLSLEKGPEQAFSAYVAPDGILLAAYPAARGREAVRSQFFASPAGMTLVWKPQIAEVASSGDLGYTVGTYELRSAGGTAAARTGKYVTIWKKQSDGSWKFVLDAGNPDSPPPSATTPLPASTPRP